MTGNCRDQELTKPPNVDDFSTKQERSNNSKTGTGVTTTKGNSQPTSNSSENTKVVKVEDMTDTTVQDTLFLN